MFGNIEGVFTPLLELQILPKSIPKELLSGKAFTLLCSKKVASLQMWKLLTKNHRGIKNSEYYLSHLLVSVRAVDCVSRR